MRMFIRHFAHQHCSALEENPEKEKSLHDVRAVHVKVRQGARKREC